MEFCVYILYSGKLDKYYTGFTASLDVRLNLHVHSAKDKFTHRADDWMLVHQTGCESKSQAMAIEKHIKAMKSKTYIKNLLKYPEMIDKLKSKYKD